VREDTPGPRRQAQIRAPRAAPESSPPKANVPFRLSSAPAAKVEKYSQPGPKPRAGRCAMRKWRLVRARQSDPLTAATTFVRHYGIDYG